MRRHPLVLGALAVVVAVGVVVAAGAFSVPATAVSVNGVTISRATLDSDLATIKANPAFGCYLEASVEVRSGSTTGLPPLGGSGSGTYDTSFVDFWLSELVNSLLIEDLASRQHLPLNATALSAGHDDLVNSISSTLGQAAAAIGQNAVCSQSGRSLVATLPSGFLGPLVRGQAAGDVVLAHAAGYGLGTGQLSRYFNGHRNQFRTICVSVIQAPTQAGATLIRGEIAAGQSFAAAAAAYSTDTTSAPNGGALGCFSANQGAYGAVAADVSGLAVGTVSPPVPNNGTYLLLEVTSYQPAVFDAVVPAVRGAVLAAGGTRASSELAGLTKTAQVSIDPRYGRWSGASGVGIEPPRSPATTDLLNPRA